MRRLLAGAGRPRRPPSGRAPRPRGGARGGAGSGVGRTLFALEDDWARALVRRDGATFSRLLAPGFVYTENDRVMAREDVIRDVTAGSDTVTWAGNEDMRAHVFGQTVVVTGIRAV